MPAGPIDRAFVEIVPVFDQFNDDLNRGIGDALDGVNANVDAAAQDIGDTFDDAAVRVGATFDDTTDDIDASFARMQVGASDAADQMAVDITDAGATIRQQVRQTSDDVDQSFKRSTDNASANFRQLALDSNSQILLIDRTSQNLDASLGRLGRGVILSQVLVQAAGAAGALGAAITPVIGVAASLAPIGFAAAAGIGASALAFNGLGDAVKAVNEGDPAKIAEAMAAIPPPMREVATTIAGLNPQWQQLRTASAEAIAPGLMSALGQVNVLFPVFETVVSQAGAAVGGFIQDAAALLTSGPFRADFVALGESSNVMIEEMGRILLALIDIMRNISAVAAPFAEDLLAGVRVLAEWAARATQAGRDTGAMADFFQRAEEVGQDLLSILTITGQILGNVFGQGTQFGQGLLDTLIQLLARLRDITASAEGQRAIADFFQRLDELVPRVGVLLTNVGRILVTLADAGGGLEPILDIFITLTGVFATLLENNPALATMVAQFAVWAAILNALKIGQFVSGMLGLVNIVRSGANAIGLFSAGLRGVAGASGAAATAGRLVAAAFGVIRTAAVGLATFLGPAGLIAVAVVALVALIILNWDTVRGWLVTAWNFIREAAVTAWQAIYDAVIQPVLRVVADVVAFVTNLWNLWVFYNTLILQTALQIWNMIVTTIMTAVMNIWTFIQPIIIAIVTFITTTWTNIVTVTTTVFTAVWTFLQTIWTAISTIFTTVLTAIVTFITTNFTAVWTFIQTIWNAVWTFFTTIWNAIYQVFLTVIGLIIGLIIGEFDFREFIIGMWNTIFTFFQTIWTAIQTLFGTAITAILTLVQTWLTNVQTFITTVWTAIQTFFTTVWTAIQTVFTTVLTAIITFIQEQWTAIQEFTTTVWDAILTFLQDTWDAALETAQEWGANIVEFFTDLWNDVVDFVTDFIADFLDTLQEGWNDAIDAAIDFGNDIVDAIQDFVGDMIDVGQSLVEGLIDGIQNAAGAAVDAAVGVVQDALAAARAAIGFGSPAREFIVLGEASGEGLIVGLDRMRDSVRDAARDLAGAEIGGFTRSGSGGATGNDLLGSETGRLTGAGITIQNLNVQPISGRFNLNEIIEELVLQQKTLYANTVT